jgi:hypothetical protein
MREVVSGLGIPVPLQTPYQFATKGEMLVETRAPQVLAESVEATNSCARPNDRNASPGRRQSHCGYCVPCIIRRAAMLRAGLDDVDQYRYDVRSERELLLRSQDRRQDLWAFEIALARAAERAAITDVLRAGPLPVPADHVSKYVRVYREGLDEVSVFLRGRPVFGG